MPARNPGVPWIKAEILPDIPATILDIVRFVQLLLVKDLHATN